MDISLSSSAGRRQNDEKKPLQTLRHLIIGKRYFTLTSEDEKAKYLAINIMFILLISFMLMFGSIMVSFDLMHLAIIKFSLASCFFLALFLLRSNTIFIKFDNASHVLSFLFAAYCLFLVFYGVYYLWAAIWLLLVPPMALFLCRIKVGLIQSVIVFILTVAFLYTPIAPVEVDGFVHIRLITTYILIFGMSFFYGYVRLAKDKKEVALNAELTHERDVIKTMKNSIPQGVFTMDSELKILPLYSKPLTSILSYYESDLAGKSFIDIIADSLTGKEVKAIQKYFSMIFAKSKITDVLEEVNPISEFEYKVDGRVKVLSTSFHLIENTDSESEIIGVIQDITKEKEFEKELNAQKKVQELKIKNMFDIIQVDPVLFRDFIEDIDSNFNYINKILKDRTLTEKQVATKFFQTVHAIKSDAAALGLETFSDRLHSLEDAIKTLLDADNINVDDILSLVVGLETIMQEKNSYVEILKRIDTFKASHKIDSVIVQFLKGAAENISGEVQKKVEFKPGQFDIEILESKLKKPIKDILLQCIRNSIHHGIETPEERTKKNKSPHGLLMASIKKVDGNAEVVFSDDGEGLDWDKIKNKYIKHHPEAADISKKALLSSIFSPEFSTSDEISSIAGRGVGLSLVKDIVKENGGRIKVYSSHSGLTFKFTFPLPA